MQLRHVVLALCLLPACGPETEIEAVSTTSAAIHENQGNLLLATADPMIAISRSGATDKDGVAFDNVSVTLGYLQVRQGLLYYARDNAKLVGARFVTPGGVEVKITRACQHAAPPQGWVRPPSFSTPTDCTPPAGFTLRPDEYEYEVVTRPVGGTWQPLCRTSWNRALPVAGTFSSVGTHADSALNFSFACMDGVVSKCVNWGYKPWAGPGAFNMHQACTRMAMADYCGYGQSHTYMGTPIDLYDVSGVNSRTGGLSFEASWLPGRAYCLTKLRWQSLPLGGLCPQIPGGLRDPRLSTEGHYCDDTLPVDYAALAAAGALLFNDSGLYDRGLYTWMAGTDRYTTIAGFYGGVSGGTTPPANGYQFSAYEGNASSVQLTRMVALETWYNPTTKDHLTTTRGPLAGYTKSQQEGYIYPHTLATQPAYTTRLRSFVKGTDYLTTTASTPPTGYAFFRDEGFVLGAP